MTDCSEDEIREAVIRLAGEPGNWIPVLQAACEQARKTEPFGGVFAGAWVLQELRRSPDDIVWRPGLRILVAHGLLEKSGESTRGGRRAYYRMPCRTEIEQALDELSRRTGRG